MAVFEPRTSGDGSGRSINLVTAKERYMWCSIAGKNTFGCRKLIIPGQSRKNNLSVHKPHHNSTCSDFIFQIPNWTPSRGGATNLCPSIKLHQGHLEGQDQNGQTDGRRHLGLHRLLCPLHLRPAVGDLRKPVGGNLWVCWRKFACIFVPRDESITELLVLNTAYIVH